jgi:Ig-like domain from next to BRCA1 gene
LEKRKAMNKHKFALCCLAGLVLLGLLAGCATSESEKNARKGAVILTQVNQTVSVKLTLDAGAAAVALLTEMAQYTPTPPPAPSATPTVTPPFATLPPLPPSPTPRPPTPTVPPVPCNWLQFVSDVTVPDGSKFLPGTQFVKTWRVQNIGSCTWTRDYALVFVGGDQMSGPSAVPLVADVPPGAVVDLSVTLVAPSVETVYTGYWQLRNEKGVLFGGGADGKQPLYVRIRVDIGDEIFYDLAANFCAASWVNSRQSLPCSTGSEDETVGFVYYDGSPRLETGEEDNEPALITHPDAGGTMRYSILGEQGLIAGEFPSQLIQTGDRFEAVIGCMYGSDACNVIFYLLVPKSDGSYEVLGSWQEIYDGMVNPIKVDLSAWAGQEMKLILTVIANGSSEGDYAFWLHPRLIR